MEVKTHGRFAPYALVELHEHDEIIAEAGSLMSHENSIEAEVFVPGGLSQGILRKLAGTSFFLLRYRGPGHATFSKNHAGDLVELDVSRGDLRLQNRAFLLAEPGVTIRPELDLEGALFKKNPFPTAFTLALTGRGKVYAVGWGDVQHVVLGRGERLIAAEGKIMALDRSVRVQRLSSGLKELFVTGARLALEGPGHVWLQSRDHQAAHPKPSVHHTHVRSEKRRRDKAAPDDKIKESYIWDGHRS